MRGTEGWAGFDGRHIAVVGWGAEEKFRLSTHGMLDGGKKYHADGFQLEGKAVLDVPPDEFAKVARGLVGVYRIPMELEADNGTTVSVAALVTNAGGEPLRRGLGIRFTSDIYEVK